MDNTNLVAGLDYTGICVNAWVLDGKGDILLHKRSLSVREQAGKWDCASGRLQFGETPQQAIERVLQRKYNCSCKILDQLPAVAYSGDHSGKHSHWINIPFVVLVDPGEVKINQPLEIDELSWFIVESLPSPMFDAAAAQWKIYEGRIMEFAS